MNKHRIAHIVNVTEIDESKKPSYLHIAQPVTLKSMVAAKRVSEQAVAVELFAIKNNGEQVQIPEEFNWAADIEKYAWEYIDSLSAILPHKPLPRLVDIINGLFNESDAEFFIYSNVDIGVYPDFYIYVNDLINKNLDAFCINRRTLPKEFNGIIIDETNYELCYVLNGDLHPGIDCFVFKREIVPSLSLRNVFIGFPPVGNVLKSQLERNSKNFQMQLYARATFHLGSDRSWKNLTHPYWIENKLQAEGLYEKKRQEASPLSVNNIKFQLCRKLFGDWSY